MKKILVCALAIAALASCQKNQVLETPSSPAIAFENAFVGNATRAAVDPSYTNSGDNELKAFHVYANLRIADGTMGSAFDGDVVSKTDAGWTYQNPQYWAVGTYYFQAVAPENNDNVTITYAEANQPGVSKISFTQPEDAGSVDILYDAQYIVNNSIARTDPVSFQLDHLLSKVKFSFTNVFSNDNAFITVKNIKMSVPAAGYIGTDQETGESTAWTLEEGETVLEFGDMETLKVAALQKSESAKERLTIPATTEYSYNVTFDVELYYGSALAYSSTLATVIEGAALEKGKAYNFHATIDASNIVPGDNPEDQLQPIKFTATVNDWDYTYNDTNNPYDGGVIETITPEAALKAAIAEGGSIALTENVTLTEALTIANDVNIDLNGYTLTGNVVVNATDADVVIANGKINNASGNTAVTNKAGNLTLNNVDVVSGTCAVRTDGTWDYSKVTLAEQGEPTATTVINGGSYECENGHETTGDNAHAYAIVTYDNALVTVKDAKIKADGCIYINCSNVNAEGNDFTVNCNSAYAIYVGSAGTVNYSGNTYTSANSVKVYAEKTANNYGALTINGTVITESKVIE